MRAAATRVAAILASAALGACVTVNGPSPVPKANLHEAARINTQLGVDYMQQGDMAAAQEKLMRATSQDDEYAPAFAALGMFYARRSQFGEAEKAYRHAVELDGDNGDILNAMGAFLCQTGKTDEGLRTLIKAGRNLKYPTPEVAWTNAGTCAQGAHRDADAAKYFSEALRLNPNYPDALLRMAQMSYLNKNYLAAHGYLQRYQRVGPKTPDSLLLGARVERQLGNNQDAHDYQVDLLQSFPNSDQAQQVLNRVSP